MEQKMKSLESLDSETEDTGLMDHESMQHIHGLGKTDMKHATHRYEKSQTHKLRGLFKIQHNFNCPALGSTIDEEQQIDVESPYSHNDDTFDQQVAGDYMRLWLELTDLRTQQLVWENKMLDLTLIIEKLAGLQGSFFLPYMYPPFVIRLCSDLNQELK